MGKLIWVFGIPVYTYPTLYTLGIVGALLLVFPAFARRRGVPWRRLLLPMAAAIGVGWLCAHVAYTLINVRPLENLLWRLWHPGSGNEGIAGFVGALVTYFWLLRRYRARLGVDPADAHDALAPALAFMIIPFKLGCYFFGCCYGRLATAGWPGPTITYVPETTAYVAQLRAGLIPAGAAESLPTLPAPTAEMAAMAALMLGLGLAYRRGQLRGRLLFVFFIGFAVWRNISETWLRGDPGRGQAGPFSITQLMTVPILAWSAWAIWKEGRRNESARATAADGLSQGA